MRERFQYNHSRKRRAVLGFDDVARLNICRIVPLEFARFRRDGPRREGIYKSMKSGINDRDNRTVPLSWENLEPDRRNFSQMAKGRARSFLGRLSAVSKVWHARGSARYDFTQFQGQRNIVNLGGVAARAVRDVGERDGRGKGDKGVLSRAISTAHCAMLVAHNSDPVQLGPFPTIQDYPLYWQDRPGYNRWHTWLGWKTFTSKLDCMWSFHYLPLFRSNV